MEAVDDPELQEWLRGGLEAWRAGEDLDRALGLSGPQATKARDAAIRRCADLLDRHGALSTWAKAGHVEAAMKHYESIVWPRRHSLPKRLADTPLKAALHEWMTMETANGVRPIRVQRALYEILRF
ncbi:hypothetical protein DEM34_12150 [Spiribacter halobius]|uniref:Uncharacterized protein n=1 Tax=Sediminicurvatus halobius TaxID=2182432 RepID=A0A2U2MZV6_9GAMM|nr:hypothetical protein DEM34_12150 [Spiribacter halobius]